MSKLLRGRKAVSKEARHYKITVSEGDICIKHAKIDAKCVWHVFQASGVSYSMNGKGREIPVTSPERELH